MEALILASKKMTSLLIQYKRAIRIEKYEYVVRRVPKVDRLERQLCELICVKTNERIMIDYVSVVKTWLRRRKLPWILISPAKHH